MCGRYVLTTPGEVLAELFELDEKPRLEPRWNIAPTQEVAIVRPLEERRELAFARWGLIPSWAKEASIGHRMINARGETVGEKPGFRDSFRKRRCLMPADGFYEWEKIGARKQPWLLRRRGGAPFAFAGLWSRWRDPAGGEPVDTCALVTTTPNELAARVHDRMPVILPPGAFALWLAPESDPERLLPLLVPLAAREMEAWPVSTWVNDPRHDDARCVEPAAGGPAEHP
jgi:putative SOS response-associated peptidase YedK